MMVLCEPKHVGAAFVILTTLIIKGFYNLCALVGQQSVWYYWCTVQPWSCTCICLMLLSYYTSLCLT